MSLVTLSPFEQAFILSGIEAGVRADGRERTHYRHFTIETGILPNANGSARLQLSSTDVLVGVKAEIGEPDPAVPDEGCIHFFVDCSASASPLFEGRGGDVLSTELARTLDRAIGQSKALDLKSLCIVPGQQAWHIYVDAVVLVHGGNLLDAISFAVKAALFDTRIPKLTVQGGDGDNPLEIELSDDPNDFEKLDISNLPVLVTLTKIGRRHIVDATMEEEACMMASVVVGVTKNGTICCVQKGGLGGVDPSSLYEMIESGRQIGMSVNSTLDEFLQKEEVLHGASGSRKLGFLSTGH